MILQKIKQLLTPTNFSVERNAPSELNLVGDYQRAFALLHGINKSGIGVIHVDSEGQIRAKPHDLNCFSQSDWGALNSSAIVQPFSGGGFDYVYIITSAWASYGQVFDAKNVARLHIPLMPMGWYTGSGTSNNGYGGGNIDAYGVRAFNSSGGGISGYYMAFQY